MIRNKDYLAIRSIYFDIDQGNHFYYLLEESNTILPSYPLDKRGEHNKAGS